MAEKTNLGVTKESKEAGHKLAEELFVGGERARAEKALRRGDEPDEWSMNHAGWVMGYIFQRPGLDLRLRTLVALAMNAVTMDAGSSEILRTWIIASLAQGFTEEQIREVCIMVHVYGSSPKSRKALEICKQVFAELAAQKGL